MIFSTGFVAVVCGYLLLLAGVQAWADRMRPDPELTRKGAHLGGALLTLPFPWLFRDLLQPLLICGIFVLLLEATRRRGWLRAVHGIGRPSRGAVLFPLGLLAGLVASMTRHDPWIHVVSVLELGVCDTLAALAGRRWGRASGNGGSTKTVQGSSAFFVSSVVVVLGVSAASSRLGPGALVPVAIGLAGLFTWVEALGSDGWDNLAIPLAVALAFPLADNPEHAMWKVIGLGLLTALGLFFVGPFRCRKASTWWAMKSGRVRP